MFVTGPLAGGDPSGAGGPLRVRDAMGRTFDEPLGQVLNPTLRGYVADMAAPYGIAVREDLIEAGAGYSYGEMCAPLLCSCWRPESLTRTSDVPPRRT
jgi:hypothetical protein